MEFAMCKSSDAWNFEVALSFLENLFVPGIDYAAFSGRTLRYEKLTSVIPITREDSTVKNLLHAMCFARPVLSPFFSPRKCTWCKTNCY